MGSRGTRCGSHLGLSNVNGWPKRPFRHVGHRGGGGGRHGGHAISERMRSLIRSYSVAGRNAQDGIEAFEAIERDPPALVLLDILLPRQSGSQVWSPNDSACHGHGPSIECVT